MKEEPIFKQCGRSFIPLIKEVLHRLTEEERIWIKANVRFTQRSANQNIIDEMILGMDNADYHALYQDLMQKLDKSNGLHWKRGRYHYIKLHPRILKKSRDYALYVIAHELGHAFTWKPAKDRPAETIQEQQADEWAFKRGWHNQ